MKQTDIGFEAPEPELIHGALGGILPNLPADDFIKLEARKPRQHAKTKWKDPIFVPHRMFSHNSIHVQSENFLKNNIGERKMRKSGVFTNADAKKIIRLQKIIGSMEKSEE